MIQVSDEGGITLAVDPGGTTGLAWIVDFGAGGMFGGGQIAGGRYGFLDHFGKMLEMGLPLDAVVCEAFVITNQTAKKTVQPDALRIIGYLDLWCFKHGVPFTLQTPSAGKNFGTDEKLKYLGWYLVGQPHATDAARHLLTFLRDTPEVKAKLLNMVLG